LGYTQWGALFSGLVFGTSLFVPLRILDGNPNEVYAAFIPLCLLLIGLACKGRKIALIILPFVFYTMLSDGKLTCFMGLFYIGILCVLSLIPIFKNFIYQNSNNKINICPLKIFLFTLLITFFIGMVRILPALEIIRTKGGLGNMQLFFYPKEYSVYNYTFEQLWQELLGWKGRQGLVTLGWVPVILFGVSLLYSWRNSLPWLISAVLFGWLLLANNAPIDLFRILWNLPIFNAARRTYKYFSFQIVFTLAIGAGQCFFLLKKLRPRWLEHIIAIVLIAASLCFLYPKMAKIQRDTYNYELSDKLLVPAKEFFNVQSKGLQRNRSGPFRSITYFNLLRGIGTIDWYTGIPIDENAIPKYFVNSADQYIPNPEYQGEVFFLPIEDKIQLSSAIPTVEKQFPHNKLTGLWHFDIINDNIARDSSKNETNGKLVGMDKDEFLVKGKFGNALMFNGNNWIDIKPSRSLRLNEDYSLSVWINPFDMPRNMERFIIDSDFWRSGSRYSLVLHNGFVRFMHNYVGLDNEGNIIQVPYGEAGLVRNRWHHIAAVSTKDELQLYVDGEIKAVKPYSKKNQFKKDVSLRIGGRTDPPQLECFKGLVDDVAIWNRALTTLEVKKLWLAGGADKEMLFGESTAEIEFRPNSIAVQANIVNPCTLVINQNYHRDWHTDKGEIVNKYGLIALKLNEIGSYKIHLRYISRSFYIGLAISILNLLVIIFFCWTYRKKLLKGN